MAANGLRRGLIALVLLVALAGAGVVLASGGALLQADGGGDDGQTGDDAISPDNRTVDTDRVNVSVELAPSDDLDDEIGYELVVIGEVAAANDAANDTVDCTGELCVVSGTLSPDAEGEDLPRYELHGVVTSATPEDGYSVTVNGTLEGNAIEGLGLGAYNVSAPNGTDESANNSILAGADGTAADTADESGDASDPTDGDDAASASDDDEAATSDDDEAATSDDEETAASSVEALQTDGGTSEDAASDGDAGEEGDASEDSESNDGDASDDAESGDDANEDAESASVTFDGCSSATVEGDAYGYEAGLRYYVPSGLDTSTYDQSEISTPATVDGNDVISDARTTDVVVESVLVLDEDFGVLTQVSNPNYDDCADTIEQQHADWEDEQGETEESADENASDESDAEDANATA